MRHDEGSVLYSAVATLTYIHGWTAHKAFRLSGCHSVSMRDAVQENGMVDISLSSLSLRWVCSEPGLTKKGLAFVTDLVKSPFASLPRRKKTASFDQNLDVLSI